MSLFKFKKAKVMVGEFDPDDSDEWTLLIKPQIQDTTLFVHFHKMWNVTEVPEVQAVEADDANGIAAVEYQPGVYAHPSIVVFVGFVKEGNFIVTKSKSFSFESFANVKKDYLIRLEEYVGKGFTKDWNMYSNDIAQVPHYYGNKPLPDASFVGSRPGTIPVGSPQLTTKKLFKHIMLGKPQTIKTP